jgi:hypothetical protein
MKRLLQTLVAILMPAISNAQVAKTQVVRLNATANSNGSITITWPAENWAGNWAVYRRDNLAINSWGNALATLAGTANTYTDATAKAGKSYEYLVAKTNAQGSQALGYIYAGNRYVDQPEWGGIILLIDSNYINPLSSELARLKNQLKREGWLVSSVYAGRKEMPEKVRDRVIAEFDKRKGKVRTVLIIGHVPVPYSGDFTGTNIPPPDGHVEGSGNHTGAWPADGYYGDVDGIWGDIAVDRTNGHTSRLYNVPRDGKFDPTKFPGEVELEVGRIDFFDMPAFSKNDTLLMRKYLNRNHLWRNNLLSTTERALIDNNFSGLNLASTGYHNLTAMLPIDSVYDNKDYFTAQKANAYLWSYGCGAGYYNSCSGVGNTSNFKADSLQNIFTMLAGSYFGDWDSQDNLMRAALCNSALTCFWGGIPKWYVHQMGLGMNIGFGTKVSMNNVDFYFNGSFNFSHNSVHMALMGDPTLKMRHLPEVKSVAAGSQNGYVKLNWPKAKGTFDGYAVYRYDSVANSYYRVNKNHIIKDSFYTDSTNYYNGLNRYAVRTIKLETTASGSWYNTGAGAFTAVNHTNTSKDLSIEKLSIYPNPTSGQSYIQLSYAAGSNTSIQIYDATGRMISKTGVAQGSTVASVSADDLAVGIYRVVLLRNNQISGSVSLVKNQ